MNKMDYGKTYNWFKDSLLNARFNISRLLFTSQLACVIKLNIKINKKC